MKKALFVSLFVLPLLVAGQSVIGTNDEPIRRTASGNWVHDGPSKKAGHYKPQRESAIPLGMKRPRPYFYGGMSLQGNGSSALNYAVGSGIQENAPHFLFDGYAEYSNTRKTDDNTINNFHGRTRLLYATGRYRFKNGWFVGPGARWSELSTTNYVKPRVATLYRWREGLARGEGQRGLSTDRIGACQPTRVSGSKWAMHDWNQGLRF
jgi:hypothetical protein